MSDSQATKILIIDDEKEICSLFKEFFMEEGCAVEVSYDGEDGIAKVKSFEPNIIIVDHRMPIMDGSQVIRTVRESFSTPIICVSAFTNQDSIDECLKLGANDYLAKPIILEDLMDKVQACIDKLEK